MSFELFKEGGKRGLKPKIKIRPNGQIYLNLGAIRKFNLENFKYVQLFYDKENGKIGIMRTNDDNAEGKLSLVVRQKSSSSWISAKSFFLYYEIDLPEPNDKGEIDFEIGENEMIILKYPGPVIPENEDEDDVQDYFK